MTKETGNFSGEDRRSHHTPLPRGESLAGDTAPKGISLLGMGKATSRMEINDNGIDVPVNPPDKQNASLASDRSITKQPNEVAEYVLDSVSSWENLNAPSMEEGEVVFQNALQSSLRDMRVGDEVLGRGGMRAHAIEGNEDIVLKRVIVGALPEGTADERFEQRIAEHDVTATYFGDFVPPTEFATIDGANFDNAERPSDREYVSLQKRVSGIEFNGYETAEDTIREIAEGGVTPKTRERIDAFVSRYERMADEEGLIPECQMFVDTENETMWVVDTDNPLSFNNFSNNNGFLQEVTDSPETITPAQAVDMITAHAPGYADLREKSWEEVKDEFTHKSVRLAIAEEAMYEQWGYAPDLRGIIMGLELFPPEGDNLFIRNLRAHGLASPKAH